MKTINELPDRSQASTAPSRLPWKSSGLLMAVTLALLQLMNEVGALIAIPFYGPMGAELGLGPGQVSWAVAATLLAGGASVPVLSKIGDLHGHRRVLMICLLLITVGFILSAIAPNFITLVIGRALIGVVAGQALTIGILNDRLEPHDRRKAIGIIAAFQAIGIPLGLALGGLLIDAGVSWRVGFWIGAILTVIGLVATLAWVAESDARIRNSRSSRKVNYAGVLLMGVGLTSLCIGVNESTTWGIFSGATMGFVLTGLALVALSFYWESKSQYPLLDVRKAFSTRLLPAYAVFVQTGIIGLILFSTILGWGQTSPETLGYGFGLTLFSTALLFTPYILAGFVAPRFTIPLLQKYPAKWVQLLSAVLSSVGILVIYLGHTSIPAVLVGILIYSFGFTAMVTVAVNVIAAEATAEQGAGTASVYVSMALFASALGTALYAAAISAGHGPMEPPTPANYETALLIAVVASFIGLISSFLLSSKVRLARVEHGH